MDSKSIAGQVFSFLIYIFVQVLLMRYFVLFEGVAACFVYISFLLLLPFETGSVLLLLLGFATGLLTDIFYDTLGIHAAACVMLAFLRPLVIRLLTPRGGYEDNSIISLNYMGISWFVPYAFLLVLVHHLVLFFAEAAKLSLFFPTLLKVVASSLFTTLLIVILQYLFYKNKY
ncbi:MAG: Rod shape-determining protein MreD [Verrucomicrobia bacterium]|nr:Rod shape-determining protein MreD [Cytophagales bacterium]